MISTREKRAKATSGPLQDLCTNSAQDRLIGSLGKVYAQDPREGPLSTSSLSVQDLQKHPVQDDLKGNLCRSCARPFDRAPVKDVRKVFLGEDYSRISAQDLLIGILGKICAGPPVRIS